MIQPTKVQISPQTAKPPTTRPPRPFRKMVTCYLFPEWKAGPIPKNIHMLPFFGMEGVENYKKDQLGLSNDALLRSCVPLTEL